MLPRMKMSSLIYQVSDITKFYQKVIPTPLQQLLQRDLWPLQGSFLVYQENIIFGEQKNAFIPIP